jgi:hypothetical protein
LPSRSCISRSTILKAIGDSKKDRTRVYLDLVRLDNLNTGRGYAVSGVFLRFLKKSSRYPMKMRATCRGESKLRRRDTSVPRPHNRPHTHCALGSRALCIQIEPWTPERPERPGSRGRLSLQRLQDARQQLAGPKPHHRNVGCQLPQDHAKRLSREVL